jgi:4-diphosphocytidyl-2-C-methyl-D-erythritol kinase
VHRERAYAKVNLVLRVGPPGEGGLHQVCSLFASIDLADEVELHESPDGADSVICPSVPGENLAARALAAFREITAAELPPLAITIHKRIPVAAGLGGGSADAAAVLRAANEMAGRPLGGEDLVQLAAPLGSDVPSQIEPAHAIVTGKGEGVERVELPQLPLLLVPDEQGLATGEVFAELDRLGATRTVLDPAPLRRLAAAPAEELAARLENDLEPAALSLRPKLADTLERLREAGALGVRVTGSGPTCFGVFEDLGAAQRAWGHIPGSIVATVRQ